MERVGAASTAVSRLRVAVLMGGPSGERGISMQSGAAVLAALDRERFEVRGIEVTEAGTLRPVDGKAESEVTLEDDASRALSAVGCGSLDVAVVAMHGRFGEDGVLQGLLDAAGVPYTGSGVPASALAMDKERAKIVVERAGVRVPPGRGVDPSAWRSDPEAILDALAGEPGFPCFVKPSCGGSSLGAGPAEDRNDLRRRIEDASTSGAGRILVERRLVGREVTCAVLGNRGRPLRTLPVVEIVTRADRWFDFDAKYTEGGCEEVCPAPLDEETTARVEEAARRAHGALGCDGMSRSDFLLVDGEPWYLETNTIPGLTEASLCPRAARAAGHDMRSLMTLLVEMALERAASQGDEQGARNPTKENDG